MPLAAPECTPSVRTSTVSVPAEEAAQRGRRPQLLVVAAARVEADDEVAGADAVGQLLDVGGQVGAAALLAGLDQPDAAGVRDALRLQRLDRGSAANDGVAVVGAAAAVELVVAPARASTVRVLAPAGHLRLLVEVAVEQDGVAAGARNLHEDDRRAARQADHLDASTPRSSGLAGPVGR